MIYLQAHVALTIAQSATAASAQLILNYVGHAIVIL